METNNKIDEAQVGSRRGHSAVDTCFFLHVKQQTYISRNGGFLYCLHADFKMAFDKINHAKLFESLLNKGVDGKFINILYELTSNLRPCVKPSSGGELASILLVTLEQGVVIHV